MTGSTDGWAWLSTEKVGQDPNTENTVSHELARMFAHTFMDGDGERVLSHLRAITKERTLGPEVPDASLRYLEGQRNLITYIERLTARGRA